MTKDEIIERWDVLPNAQRNEWIAKEIFKAKPFYEDWDENKERPQYIPSGKPKRTHAIDARPVPRFSTDMSSAWLLVEKMEQEGFCPCLVNDDQGHWQLAFNGIQPVDEKFDGQQIVDVVSELWRDTAPEAICLGVLCENSC